MQKGFPPFYSDLIPGKAAVAVVIVCKGQNYYIFLFRIITISPVMLCYPHFKFLYLNYRIWVKMPFDLGNSLLQSESYAMYVIRGWFTFFKTCFAFVLFNSEENYSFRRDYFVLDWDWIEILATSFLLNQPPLYLIIIDLITTFDFFTY